MKKRFQQFGSLFSALGFGGCFRYLTLGALADAGEISRYRSTRVALVEIPSPMETVRNASLLALRRLPGQVQTVTVMGKCTRIMATINEMDLFIRLKRTAPQSTRMEVDTTRSTAMGQAVAGAVLAQTCGLAREMSGSKTIEEQRHWLMGAAEDVLFFGGLTGG